MKRIILIIFCILAAFAANAQGLRVPKFFGDNMVLQQQTDANIWGWAPAGAKVKIQVSWSGARYSVKAGSDGFWKVAVATPAASFTPQTVTISSGKEKITLGNLLIGEVWLCGGQSNMEMPLGGWPYQPIEGGAEAMRDSHSLKGLRMAFMPHVTSEKPEEDIECKWNTTDDGSIASWSAVAYFFGCRLTRELDVPVGLIVSCWGGSMLECWTDRATLRSLGLSDEYIDNDIKTYMASAGWHTNTVMYNAMIHPLRHYTINGFIWYQGCSNVSRLGIQDYAQYQAGLVKFWRTLFGRGDLPFYYVQIAPHPYAADEGDSGLAPLLRERQRVAASLVPNSAMAPTCDLVYEFEKGIIHPRQKEPVGDRLAYLALENWYGIKGLGSASPEFVKMEADGAKARIWLSNATGGLHGDTGWQFSGIDGFEVSGEDGRWHPAIILGSSGDTIEIGCEEVPEIKNVRYLWHDFAIGRLWNGYGMPIVPFCTSL